MANRRFQLNDQQLKALIRAYTECKHGPTRTRYQAVRLYGSGYPVEQIIEITGCSRRSLMEWCQSYRREGLAGLVDKRVGGNRAKLTAKQIQELSDRLRQYRPYDLFGPSAATDDGQFWTVEDLQRAVKQWYGVDWQSRTSYYNLLSACGFSYQRPAKVFKSRRERQIADFQEQLEKN